MKDELNNWGKEKKSFVFLIDFECRAPLAWLVDSCPDDFKYNFHGFTNHLQKTERKEFQFDKFPISIEEYAVKFNKVIEHIAYGNSFLINLTCVTPIKTDLLHQDIFQTASSKYKLWFKNNFVCFSPETFIQIKSSKIYSFPMKGTIDASIDDSQRIILSDVKEQCSRESWSLQVSTARSMPPFPAPNTLCKNKLLEFLSPKFRLRGLAGSQPR